MNKLVAQTLAKKENGEKGFTLIELLVVVIIIGILAAIAIPIFLNMRQGAWRSSVESDVKNAVLAIETVTTQSNGKVPTALAQTFAPGATALDKTGAKVTGTTPTVATITVSPDDQLVVAVNADNTYTVTGTNTNLTGATDGYFYDSKTGAGDWSETGYKAP